MSVERGARDCAVAGAKEEDATADNNPDNSSEAHEQSIIRIQDHFQLGYHAPHFRFHRRIACP
jgi:hypothetical protein